MRIALIPGIVASLCQPLWAATTQLNWSTERELLTAGTSKLSAGTAANGDGTLLELG